MRILNLHVFIVIFFLPIVTRHDKEKEAFYADPADYPGIIQLRLRDLTGFVEMEGSFIQSDWILTAAHGLNSVEAGQRIDLFDSTYTLRRIIVHPDFEGFEHDLALIQLDRPALLTEPIPLVEDTLELGEIITIVGRGWTGTGLTGPVVHDNRFRMATNRIDSVSKHWIKFRFDEPDHPNTTAYEGVSGSGDSGGPAFITVNGQLKLAGISSNQRYEQLQVKEGHYGVVEYYTRVSTYTSWIHSVLRGEIHVDKPVLVSSDGWGFPDTEIGDKANQFMDAIISRTVSDDFMTRVFYPSFRESFDLKGFVTGISNDLVNPKIKEIIKAKSNVLIFTVSSANKTYLIQLEADKRDNYLIGGLVYKRINE